jgi:hypothetical protein
MRRNVTNLQGQKRTSGTLAKDAKRIISDLEKRINWQSKRDISLPVCANATTDMYLNEKHSGAL